MRALVTNDDGIDSPGLHALARAAVSAGLDASIAAPAAQSSGTSAGLMSAEDDGRVVVTRRDVPGVPVARAVAAHPGLIALLAARGSFDGTPDVLLSGINHGANIGRAVLHSGTVGAALTASINGVSALAVSLDVGLTPIEDHWDTAAAVAQRVLPLLRDMPPGTVLNLNVPNVPLESLEPLRWATLSEFGLVQTRVDDLDDGSLARSEVLVEGEQTPGSDAALLAAGHPTLTPLRSVQEDTGTTRPDLPG
ncbi:5'/3'-nucleotidase SurE [Umezawaea beigongshangensis]|uniref:5'/3'-nucleotidase SurE n=1 Tax=Umezawaea beigongshangensis TaxID=2780383 RepID=UPI0018F1A3D9|nr:5'/3'-nucleotidase SurE [Umezawaea beigongshangensis]